MRCYLVIAQAETDEGEVITYRRYAGTQAESREARDELMELAGCKKKDVSIDEVDVPMSKAELLSFLNDLVKEDA